ncbi:MAG: M56 family metallopeptidase [Bacteroidales bacterium]|nr:M56 family metallopeptidase [Bacteroidales bacterium]
METLIILGKYIIATGLLLLFYWGVLRHRASYRLSRNYLTGIPALGLLMCIVSFEVPMQMPRSIEQKMERIEEHFTPWDDAATNDVPLAEIGTTSPSANATEEIPSTMKPALEASETAVAPAVHTDKSMTFDDWAIMLLIAVSGLLLLLFVYYIAHVLSIKNRLSHEQTQDGYNLVRSKSVNTPFSFGKTIFLPSDLDQRSEDLIIRHEMAHIAHRHYLEVWHIEFWTRLCWFNPVMWLCRTELRNVHEFEADRDVISQGADIHSYQTTLLEMVMNESCPAVNGFNHSFIRQRFIEMKSSTAGTLGRFGKVSLLLWIAILFGSFTLRPASSITETEWKMPTFSEPQLFVLDGELDKELSDTSFKIYLSDEFFHIEEDTPFAVVPVVDGKIHYEVPLTQMVAGRLCGMNRDGKPTETKVETYFVPGQKVSGRIYRRFLSFHSSFGNVYDKAIQRTIAAVRHGSGAQSPHYPHVEGKIWEQINGNELIDGTKSVHFAKDKTILHTFPVIVGDMIGRADFSDEIFLEDPHGNRYKYLGHYPESDQWNNIESAAYGTYNFFEPMPKNVEYFNIGYTSNF